MNMIKITCCLMEVDNNERVNKDISKFKNYECTTGHQKSKTEQCRLQSGFYKSVNLPIEKNRSHKRLLHKSFYCNRILQKTRKAEKNHNANS